MKWKKRLSENYQPVSASKSPMEKSITESSTPGKSGTKSATKSPLIEKSGTNISQNEEVNNSMVPGSNPDSNDESYAVNFGNF